MKKPEGESLLSVRPRETDVVTFAIPKDTLASLRQVATQREMSEQALLKFYIGQGLRQDLSPASLGTACWRPRPTFSHGTSNLTRQSPPSCAKSARKQLGKTCCEAQA